MSKNVINQIKTLLGIEIKFEQMKLDNGTIIEAESFEVDFDVFVVSESGEKIPAPDGEHTLENGVVITVANGVIVAVGDAQEPSEEPIEEVEVEASVEGVKEPKKVVESTVKETHFSAEQITELETLLERMFEQHLAKSKEVIEEVEVKSETQEIVEEPKKEEMSEVIKHNPEKVAKSFNRIKRNVGYSTKQTILSKLSKIQK